MKFKLDENIGRRGQALLAASGPDSLLERIREFLLVLQQRPLGKELWIVEPGRVRIHQSDDEFTP